MELLKGVHVIESMANCALLTEDRLILIDTTENAQATDVLAYMKKAGLKPTDITSILISHVHPDHVSGLAALKDASDAEVAAHQIEVEFISKRKPYFDWDLAHAPVEVDVPLEDGDRYQELTVLHTPGHTPGSIALLDEAHDLLIAGDSMRVLDDGLIAPMDDTYNIDPVQHRDSMRKLTGFSFEALIVGHGAAMASGASNRLKDAVAKLQA